MKKEYLKYTNGMTLVEMLVVVTIVIMLGIIGLYLTYTQIFKGYDARRKTDVKQIQVALEEYEKDHNCYPDSLPACETAGVLGTYIPKVPCDPRLKTPYVYTPGPDGTACKKWYWVFVDLENDADRQIEEVGCTGLCGPNVDNQVFNFYMSSPGAPLPYGAEGGTEEVDTGVYYWGCFGGVCQETVEWREDIIPPNWSCHPNYSTDGCSGMCGQLDAEGDFINECTPI